MTTTPSRPGALIRGKPGSSQLAGRRPASDVAPAGREVEALLNRERSDNSVIHNPPTDAEIEQTLRNVEVASWRRLTDAIDAVLAEDEHGGWAGGKQIGTRAVEGSDRPVIQFLYPVYSGAVNALIEALYEVGAIVPFNWDAWSQRHQRGAAAFENASAADAVRFLTATVRGERFGDGTILEALNDGTMLGALRALRHWRNRQPYKVCKTPPRAPRVVKGRDLPRVPVC